MDFAIKTLLSATTGVTVVAPSTGTPFTTPLTPLSLAAASIVVASSGSSSSSSRQRKENDAADFSSAETTKNILSDEEDDHSPSSSICTGQFDDDVGSSSSCDQQQEQNPHQSIATSTRDSLLVYLDRQRREQHSHQIQKNQLKENDDDDDNDTVSTATNTSVDEDENDCSLDDSALSISSSSETSSNSSKQQQQQRGRRSVSFATNLVSEIYTRPSTSPDEKYYLYYTDVDYLDFKLHYLSRGKSKLCKRSTRKVEWKLDVEESHHEVLSQQERQQHDLYYQESELQGFLDDFVASLQQR